MHYSHSQATPSLKKCDWPEDKAKSIAAEYPSVLHFLECSRLWKQGAQTRSRSFPCADGARQTPLEGHCWCNTPQEHSRSLQTTEQCPPCVICYNHPSNFTAG